MLPRHLWSGKNGCVPRFISGRGCHVRAVQTPCPRPVAVAIGDGAPLIDPALIFRVREDLHRAAGAGGAGDAGGGTAGDDRGGESLVAPMTEDNASTGVAMDGVATNGVVGRGSHADTSLCVIGYCIVLHDVMFPVIYTDAVTFVAHGQRAAGVCPDVVAGDPIVISA